MSTPNARHSVPVLIVEDNSMSRAALTWLLKELGFDPVAVGDLASAREALALATPRILILDLMLPDGFGTELLAQVRREGRDIKVAVVTAVTDAIKLEEVTALKVDAVFGKPMDIDDFDDWLVKQLATFSLDASPGSMRRQEISSSERLCKSLEVAR